MATLLALEYLPRIVVALRLADHERLDTHDLVCRADYLCTNMDHIRCSGCWRHYIGSNSSLNSSFASARRQKEGFNGVHPISHRMGGAQLAGFRRCSDTRRRPWHGGTPAKRSIGRARLMVQYSTIV